MMSDIGDKVNVKDTIITLVKSWPAPIPLLEAQLALTAVVSICQ
jgi:hypothetical protein